MSGKKEIAELGKNTRFSGERAVEMAKRSVEVRRVCKSFRDAIRAIAEETKQMKNGDEINGYEALARSMLTKAIQGDTRAAAVVLKMSGEDLDSLQMQMMNIQPVVIADFGLKEDE